MRSGRRWGATGTVWSVLIGVGCTSVNPAYDGGLEPEEPSPEWVEELDDGALDDTEEPVPPDDEGPGASDDEPGDEPGDEPPPQGDDEPEVPLLYSSLDALGAVIEPEVGAGEGLFSDPAPEITAAVLEQGLRTTTGSQWFAFPQHDGQTPNVDHAAGSLELDVKVEFQSPHVTPRDLVSLAGVLPDGGGIRLGASGLFEGNVLVVEYIDAQAQPHRTRYPAGLLPREQWVHVALSWQADVEPDEANVELWIDGEWIEPLPGYAAGPKEVGGASPDDVLIFGSWALGGGYSADASFDEIEIWGE